MTSLADTFYTHITALLETVRTRNAGVLRQLAPVIGRSIAEGGMVHTFGSGHSDIIAREIIGRAGGLVCVNGIIDPTGGFVENLVGYGTQLVERHDRQYQLLPGETIIIISNSGKNSSPLEVALYAKKKGLNVVGLTSVAMSSTYATVHPGGKNLHAVADYVLDNGGIPGDAVVEVAPGTRAGPTSTLTSALLLNLLMLEVTDWLRAQGQPLPVLVSQNLPGTVEHNRALGQKYKHRLSRQLT